MRAMIMIEQHGLETFAYISVCK